MEMKEEYKVIHNALHTEPYVHSVEVHGVHRLIKTTKKGRKRFTFLQYGGGDIKIVAVAKWVTVIEAMMYGHVNKAAGKITLRGYQQVNQKPQ